MRGSSAAAAGVLFAVALSGCRAEVTTGIEVTGPETGVVTVTATFTGEAGEAVAEDAATRSGLVDAFTKQSGVKPDVRVEDDKVTASAVLDYDRLAQMSGLTGVSALALQPGGGEVLVELTSPRTLRQAVADVNTGDPDAAILTDTMLAVTQVSVSVTFPGGVDEASEVPGAEVSVDGDTAVLTRTADTAGDGVWTVTGDPDSPFPWPWVGAATLLLAAVTWRVRRR